MFTGIIEQQATVISNLECEAGRRLVVSSPFDTLQAGESIAINGVCLTVLPGGEALSFDISPETLRLTTLSQLQPGDKVNVERAMHANGRFGGHYVSGHVDTTATLLVREPQQDYLKLIIGDFGMPARSYLLPKGSILIDGVSLTINDVQDEHISLMLVPHTLSLTTLGHLVVGQQVNIEFDYITRIVAHQLAMMGHLKNEVIV